MGMLPTHPISISLQRVLEQVLHMDTWNMLVSEAILLTRQWVVAFRVTAMDRGLHFPGVF